MEQAIDGGKWKRKKIKDLNSRLVNVKVRSANELEMRKSEEKKRKSGFLTICHLFN